MGNARFHTIFTKDFLEEAYVQQERTCVEIAHQFGTTHTTVSSYLKHFGIPLRPLGYHLRKYPIVDASGFQVLTDDWHAYWVGFIAADGTITDTHSLGLHMAISVKDAGLLQNFLEGIHATNPMITYQNNGYGNHMAVKVAIHCKELVEALAQWGITPRKSLALQWPDMLPHQLIAAYIRGYFDGDGTIYQRYRQTPNTSWIETVCRFTSGSTEFLDGLQQALHHYKIRTVKRYRNQVSNAFVLPLSGTYRNLSAFAHLIYDGCTVCLERKRLLFPMEREENDQRY